MLVHTILHCVRYIDVLSYHEKHFENELEDVSLGPPSQVAHTASSVCMCTMCITFCRGLTSKFSYNRYEILLMLCKKYNCVL